MGFENALAEEIWTAKYRFVAPDGEGDCGVDSTIARVARAVAQAEAPKLRGYWQDRVTERSVPAPARMRPAGMNRKSVNAVVKRSCQ